MKPVYSNISPQRGVHIGGIFNLQVLPKEWLLTDALIDFNSNTVLTALSIAEDKNFITLQLIEDSIEYEETHKTNANGSYYEVVCGGLLNYHNAELLQLLETLRYHELIVIPMDKNKNQRLVGNTLNAMIMSISHSEKNDNGGTSVVTVSLRMELEKLPPYYVVASSSSS